jgi:hypothetical protein
MHAVHYCVTHEDRPHVVLFMSPRLEDVADAIGPQPDATKPIVYASDDVARDLHKDERRELAKRGVSGTRPLIQYSVREVEAAASHRTLSGGGRTIAR